jgi:coenzyme F420-0:L-glutamate ligase
VKITAIRTPIIAQGQRLLPILQNTLPRPLRERDIICITSKVISMEQGRVIELSRVKAGGMGGLAPAGDDPHASPQLEELVRREADHVFGATVVWLTLKNGVFVANAGIDLSNAPEGFAILWPTDPWEWGRLLRQELQRIYGLRELGVLITDSRVVPLRRGVTGVAMAYAGFEGVESQKGKPDLFGRPLQFTEKAVADDLASAHVLVTGEANEQTPFALIEDAPVIFTDRAVDPAEILIDPLIDMFESIYSEEFKRAVSGGLAT